MILNHEPCTENVYSPVTIDWIEFMNSSKEKKDEMVRADYRMTIKKVSFSQSPSEIIGESTKPSFSNDPSGTTNSILKTTYNPNQESEEANVIVRDGWSLDNTLDKCIFDAERFIDEEESQRRIRLRNASIDEYNKRNGVKQAEWDETQLCEGVLTYCVL